MQLAGAIVGFALILFTSACGGTPAAPDAPTATLTQIPTFQFTQPTAPPAVATSAAATQTARGEQAALDPQAVERGRGRYVALECGSCHGDAGEGVADKGASLIVSTQDEETFIGFMRSGGNIGPSHQYSTNRLSDSGGRNLYQYLLSLRASE